MRKREAIRKKPKNEKPQKAGKAGAARPLDAGREPISKPPASDVHPKSGPSDPVLITEAGEVEPAAESRDSEITAAGSSGSSQDAVASDAASEAETILELLAFRLADEEYAIDILTIKEIIRSVEITPVPRTKPFIKGIISLRGMVIPIFDLRTRLGLAESAPDRGTRILVVMLEKGFIGLIADQVTEVVKVKAGRIDPPPSSGGSSSGYLKGVTRVDGRLLILLDLEKAVATD